MSLADKKGSPRSILLDRMPGSCMVPGCAETVYYAPADADWFDESGGYIQHGEDPEHRAFIRWAESTYAWLLRVHEYEFQQHIRR